MSALRVIAAGPGVTFQDGGRHGYLRFGVTGAGPMDRAAHALANRVLGNSAGAAAIEVSLGGVELEAQGVVTLAVAGGDFAVARDGRALPGQCVVTLAQDQRLRIRPGASGAWCYVALAGRFLLEPALGSLSAHTRSNLGPPALAAGQEIAVAAYDLCADDSRLDVDAPADAAIRVLMGPQDDYFSPEQIALLLHSEWRVGGRSDRMAYTLEGPLLVPAHGFNIVSDGVAEGAIQVPGEGKPIVLMADRQPTGGYPKIANVIAADLGLLAQKRPGDAVRFRAVSHDEAVTARRDAAARAAVPPTLTPLLKTHFSSEELLGVNLVGGVVAGEE